MKKKLRIVVLIACVGAGVYFYPQFRFFLYKDKVRQRVDDLGRFPTVEKVLELREQLENDAKASGLPLEHFDVRLRYESRKVAGGSDTWYYVVAAVKDGPRTFEAERRVEGAIRDCEEEMAEEGVEVVHQ